MKNNKSIKRGLLIAIVCLAIGFAAISTTLNITGTAPVTKNEADFDANVVFATNEDGATYKPTLASTFNGEATPKEVTNPEVVENGKKITFTTPKLDTVGEEVTLTYYVKNESQYAATFGNTTCSFSAEGLAESAEDYITVTPANGYNGKTLTSGVMESSDKVTVKLVKSYVGDTDLSYTITCELPATAVEK